MAAKCWKRSQVCGQAMPCRESRVRPGTCLWCYCPMGVETTVPVMVPPTRWDDPPDPLDERHPSDLRRLRFPR